MFQLFLCLSLDGQCLPSLGNLLGTLNITQQRLTRQESEQLIPLFTQMKLTGGCGTTTIKGKWKSNSIVRKRTMFFSSTIEDFLVGLISVVIINLTSLFGAIILPFRNQSAFKWILTTFIGLGESPSPSPSLLAQFSSQLWELFWERASSISFLWYSLASL